MKHVLKFSSVQAREYFEKITQGKSHNKISDLEIEIEVAKCIEDKKTKRLEKAKCKTKKAKCKDESMKDESMKDKAAKAEMEMEEPEEEEPEEDEEEMCSKDEAEELVEEVYYSVMDYIRYQNEYLMSELNYLYSSFARHQEGHLPAVKSSEQMSRVIDKLGLDKEYEVVKKVIYARTEDGNLAVSLLKDEKKS